MKRIFDVIFSGAALSVLALPLAILMIFVRVKLGSPILFKQMRPGLDGKPFLMIKLRTMTNQKKGEMLLSDAERMTNFGRFLRSSSLDELPELWNVLKGDMSLVGPRPLLMQYLERYTSKQARRHEVRPGITGWAQIMGRNNLTWDQKFELDEWYVDNRSFWLDLKIILITFKKVLKREGISSEGEVTMSEFIGSDNFDRHK